MTAWQLRDDADGQVLNDHADADYDAGGAGAPGRGPRRHDRLARDHSRQAALGWPITALDSAGRWSRLAPAISATSRHPGWTATTASGSSSTRT